MRDPFPGFTALAVANGHNLDLQVVGLGYDGKVYLAASQCSQTGIWRIRDINELSFAQRSYSDIIMSVGTDGNLHLVGLSDAQAYRIAWQDKKDGSWHQPQDDGALWPDTLFLTIRMGLGADGKLQVLGIRDDGVVYLIAWQDRDGAGTWHKSHELLPQWKKKFFKLEMGIGADGNLQVFGVEDDTLNAYIICYQNQRGSWGRADHPNGDGALWRSLRVEKIAFGRGVDGTLQVLGLCSSDSILAGDVMLLAYQQRSGWRTDGQKESLRPGTKFKALTTGTRRDGHLNAIGLSEDDGQVYLVAAHSGDGWAAPTGPDAGILGGRSAGGYTAITTAHRHTSNLLIAAVGDGVDAGLPAIAAKATVPSNEGSWRAGQSLSQRDHVGSWNIRIDDVRKAFSAVKSDGTFEQYYAPIPYRDVEAVPYKHIQGMGRYRGYDIFTHSDATSNSKGGWFLVGDRISRKLVNMFYVPDRYNHPSGCQVIGNYLAVGLEKVDGPQGNGFDGLVRFYWLGCLTDQQEPALLSAVHPQANRKGAGAVAITDIGTGSARHYVMAVYDDGAVTLSKSNGYLLDDPECRFTDLFNQRLGAHGADNICLVTQAAAADTPEKVYLISLTSSGGPPLSYDDWADLYEVDFNAGQVRLVDSRHMTTHGGLAPGLFGVHFRFGAGIELLDNKRFSFCCSERNVLIHLDANTFFPDGSVSSS